MSNLKQSELETRITFLERHIEEQDRVMHAMRKEISALESRFAQLAEQLEASDTLGEGSPANVKPPHY